MTDDREKLLNDPKAFRQQVRMAAVQVTGLRPEELEAALAYEVEPFSGIPAAEAEVAYRAVVEPDPAVRVYDVAVRRRGKAASGAKLDRWLWPAYALGALALLLAGADAAMMERRRTTLGRTVAVQERLDAQLQQVRSAARAKRGEVQALRAAREAAAKAQDDAATRRAKFPELMSVIGAAFADRAVLKSMSAAKESGAVVLAGVAATSQAAAEALTRLSARATEKGWKVRTGGMKLRELGTTVSFECEVSHD